MSRLHPQGCWPALLIFVDPGTMAPAVGPLVSAATATAAKNVKVSTPMSTVPFRPHSLIVSTCGQLPCLGVNASGVSVVARSFQPTLQKNFVHNVDIPGSVQTLCFSFQLMLLRQHKMSVTSFLLCQLKLPVLISPPS